MGDGAVRSRGEAVDDDDVLIVVLVAIVESPG